MIRKKGQRYEVRSADGRKKLGSYSSKKAAEARLKQIEYFQRRRRLAMPEELE